MYGYDNFDKISFDLGMIECFCEMVSARVKTLALSPAIEKEHFEIISLAVTEIAAKHNVNFYIEDDMILNNIAPSDYTENKYVFFFYQDNGVIKDYLKLKQVQKRALENNTYSDNLRKELTIMLCKLLSYPEDLIKSRYYNS